MKNAGLHIVEEGETPPHVASIGSLLGTWGSLLALTLITVVASRYDLGSLSIAAALGIATLKATLVALFFMHLLHEHRFLSVVLVASVFFAVLFTVFVVFDTRQYQPSIRAKAAHDAEVLQKAPGAPTPPRP